MSDNYIIMTDSACDLTPKLLSETDITLIPLEFTMNEKIYESYPNNPDMLYENFYDFLRRGRSCVTAQINVARFSKYFEPVLADGKDIIYISLSSALSGTYSSSLIAANDLMEKYPGRKIACIDSLCISMGQGLLAYYAYDLKSKGKDFDELIDYIQNLRNNICHWFTVDNAAYLERGGRISNIIGINSEIKPIFNINNRGKVIPIDKVRGRKQSLDILVRHAKSRCIAPANNYFFIGHGDCIEDAEYLADIIETTIKPREIRIGTLGHITGAHCGPGAIGIFFIGGRR